MPDLTVRSRLSHRSRLTRPVALLLAVLLMAFAFAMAFASLGHADEVNVDKYDYIFSGNIKYNGEAIEGVRVEISGGGYYTEVATDRYGKWKAGVPEKGKYDITVIESTLPEGALEGEEGNDSLLITDKGATVEAEFGLTDNKTVNFFLGDSERQTPGLFPDGTSASDAAITSTVIIVGLSGLCLLLLGTCVLLLVLLLRKPRALALPPATPLRESTAP